MLGHGQATIFGPAGIGKSALLAHLAATAAADDGARVLWSRPEPGDQKLPHAGLAELLDTVETAALRAIPGPQREALTAILRRGPVPPGGPDPLTVRLALGRLLDRLARDVPVLVAVDNAQWLDPESLDALAGAVRTARSGRLRLLVAERAGITARAGAAISSQAVPMRVPPLNLEEIAQLTSRLGLPFRRVGQLHAISGGNPAVALELGLSLAGTGLDGQPPESVPLPPAARAVVREWLAEIPESAAHTLLTASLSRRPTVGQLNRVRPGRVEEDLARAAAAQLVTVDRERVRFTAGATAIVLAEESSHAERTTAHRLLAHAVEDPIEAAWHQACASTGVSQETADCLAVAAKSARRRGDHAFAAELGLLAADRMPPVDAEKALACLVEAAEDAGLAGRADLAGRAAELIFLRSDAPADRVRARLALVDSAGQSLADTDEVLARALTEAGADPVLLAAVHLRLATKAQLCDGDPARAAAEADKAAVLAQQGNQAGVRAIALTMQARMQRVLGDPVAEQTLARAMAVPGVHAEVDSLNFARFLAARHALFDDRLGHAREELLALLPAAENTGGADDVVEVLRSLVEVEARGGHCAACLEHARRVVRLRFDAGLSPGPAWYAGAVAEMAGGAFDRAESLAELGVRASEEDHDLVFLSRNLYVRGVLKLVTGEAAHAVRLLSRVRRLEAEQQIGDPSVLRWHGELAEALVAAGEPGEAGELIEQTRRVARILDRQGVLAALDRADGVLRAARGDVEHAETLITAAAGRFAELGLRVEHGRTLLAQGRLERSRRRGAAAREAVRAAAAEFTAIGAKPWARLANEELDRLGARPQPAPRVGALSDAEAELAALVAQGVSNREAAARLFVSVKTVEARLTRIYRKLGVLSRSQLVVLLRQHPSRRP